MKKLLQRLTLVFAALGIASLVSLVTSSTPRAVDHRAAIASMIVHDVLTPTLRFVTLEAALAAQGTRAPINIVAPYRVTIGGTAVQLTTSGNVNGGVCVKALVPGQTMYLGLAGVATTTGWPMTDNESLCLEVRNANVLYGIASAAAQSVAVLPFSRF